ncbi:MAG: NUDIX domain-containing protein [Acutalibacter sp.]|nr:NUDIX domain-containing protein [Acutalibacter sp.]
MQGYNLIVVFDERREKVLLCRRRKEPYKGLLNFLGGKIEPGEEWLAAAYRELWEETGLTEADISLFHFMDLTYYRGAPCRLEVYAGRLKGPAQVQGEENQLIWQDAKEDMFDRTRFAGMGNMGHIMALLEQEDL